MVFTLACALNFSVFSQNSGILPFVPNPQITETGFGTQEEAPLASRILTNVIYNNHGFLSGYHPDRVGPTASGLYAGTNPFGYKAASPSDPKWYQTDTGISLMVSTT